MKAYFIAMHTYILFINRECICYFTNPISQYLFITDTNLFALFPVRWAKYILFSHPTGMRSFHLPFND
jgi:hypothetical protein